MEKQPPTSSAYLRNYINQLKLEAKILSEEKVSSIPHKLSPIETYAHQVLSWITALPESQQKQRYTINSIINLANLKGMHAGPPSHQHLATALRKAGFTQTRSWKKIDRNTRQWIWSPIKNIDKY